MLQQVLPECAHPSTPAVRLPTGIMHCHAKRSGVAWNCITVHMCLRKTTLLDAVVDVCLSAVDVRRTRPCQRASASNTCESQAISQSSKQAQIRSQLSLKWGVPRLRLSVTRTLSQDSSVHSGRLHASQIQHGSSMAAHFAAFPRAMFTLTSQLRMSTLLCVNRLNCMQFAFKHG